MKRYDFDYYYTIINEKNQKMEKIPTKKDKRIYKKIRSKNQKSSYSKKN